MFGAVADVDVQAPVCVEISRFGGVEGAADEEGGVTAPWPEDEPDRIDTHLTLLDDLLHQIQELTMAAQESTEADRIAEERMREANTELLRRLVEEVEANGGHAG